MSRRSHVRLLRCALALGLAIAASSLSAPAIAAAQRGGSTIASAPELPLDTAVVSGANGDEFWRVTMAVGDKLTIDFQPLNNGHVHLYLYKPSETDFTIGNAHTVAEGHGDDPSQFGWTVAEQGAWILKVSCTRGYQLTAKVVRGNATQVTPGHTVGTAIRLPLNTTFVSGNNGDEFWRVAMAARDRLTINYRSLNGGHVHLYIYSPRETDFTIGSARSAAESHTDTTAKFIWSAPTKGSWLLKVSCTRGYQLRASVKHGR